MKIENLLALTTIILGFSVISLGLRLIFYTNATEKRLQQIEYDLRGNQSRGR